VIICFLTVYNGPIEEDLKIQEEEVDEVVTVTMTMEELQKRIHENPYAFLPNSCHAMKLQYASSDHPHDRFEIIKPTSVPSTKEE
jgi:hypothetical protein